MTCMFLIYIYDIPNANEKKKKILNISSFGFLNLKHLDGKGSQKNRRGNKIVNQIKSMRHSTILLTKSNYTLTESN